MEVKIVGFRPGAQMPVKSTEHAAGYDLYAWVPDENGNPGGYTMIGRGERALIRTGLNIALPPNCEAQIRPRSGLALKLGITVLNTPGTIDEDYVGFGPDKEIGVILINHGEALFEIKHGDRIAQMVINQLPEVELVPGEPSDLVARGRTGGFGSTGV